MFRSFLLNLLVIICSNRALNLSQDVDDFVHVDSARLRGEQTDLSRDGGRHAQGTCGGDKFEHFVEANGATYKF